jgi:hypothetical protein
MRREKPRHDWIATMRLTTEEAALTRLLADSYFKGNLSETMRTAVQKMAADYGLRKPEHTA